MKHSVVIPPFLAMACAFSLGGCALTKSAALIGQHGEILRGTNTLSANPLRQTGSINLTNGKMTCSGSYEVPYSEHVNTWTFPLVCSDGRTGIATAQKGGGGKVRFSDGTEGDFIIGEGANRI